MRILFVGGTGHIGRSRRHTPPDKHARVLRQKMKRPPPPFVPIVATRTTMLNLVLQSEDLATTWTAGATGVTANAVANTSDGTGKADKLKEDGASSTHQRSQAVTITAGAAHTLGGA